MTTRWPSSGLGAVSSVSRVHFALLQPQQPHIRLESHLKAVHIQSIRRYAQSKPQIVDRPERAALLVVEGRKPADPINPPRSTLPAPLNFPTRGDENVALYYFRLGRAYGKFYITGVKAVWFNRKASQIIRKKSATAQETALEADFQAQLGRYRAAALKDVLSFQRMTRSEHQILARNSHDIGKLPLFSVLVALLGEWLPLFVPFMPGVVPGTCRIPKQVLQMRQAAEKRRLASFRQAVPEPPQKELEEVVSKKLTEHESVIKSLSEHGKDAMKDTMLWPVKLWSCREAVLGYLRKDQLVHLSSTLNLHNRMWERVNLPPPGLLLRRALSKRLLYLMTDDALLMKHGKVEQLTDEELQIACEQRGIDVTGRRLELLQRDLKAWLDRQRKDEGRGIALVRMLFRRPNAWDGLDAKR